MKNLDTMLSFDIIKSAERGYADHGWLKSAHTFSFANFYNPKQMGFSDLRVINDDYIAAGGGFGMHPHQSMEIFSYVTEGQLEHKDSMGNGEIIRSGDVQIMSAGSGVVHSEFNPTLDQTTHLFQIWIYPTEKGGTPTYQQKNFSREEKSGKLKLIISDTQEDGSLFIKQNAKIYAGFFDKEDNINFYMNKNRSYYIHVISGNISFNNLPLSTGDGLKIFEGDGNLSIKDANQAEILLFDLNKH